jgi:hypothetical protein
MTLISWVTIAPAYGADLSSYGQLYLIEERNEIKQQTWEAGLSTGMISNHPLYDVETFGLSLKKRLNLTYRTGIKYLYNNVHENNSTKLINQQLEKESKEVQGKYANHMLLAELDVLAFIGHLNFLEMKKLSSVSGFGLDLGRTIGTGADYLVFSPKVLFEIETMKDFSTGLFIGQRFLMNEAKESFTEIGLNFIFRI